MKIWLTLVCGPGSLEDLRELWEPINEHFDGLCVTCHAKWDSVEGDYLRSEISSRGGAISYLPYTGRHDLSRICAVHCGVIEQDDIVVQFDTLERLSPNFAANLRAFVTNLGNINAVYYYGKILLYRYHESITFRGTPHEGWIRQDGRANWVELSGMYSNEADVRLNVRPLKRPIDHFIKHYARYSLLPWGSNHYILPLNGKPNAQELFTQRETARMAFIDLLRELGIKRDVDAVIEYMKRGNMDPRFVAHIQRDKIWNDVYRRYIIGSFGITDDHNWDDLVEIA